MSEKLSGPAEIDHLVRQTLRDDLPSDLEDRMKVHFHRLRKVMEGRGNEAPRRPRFPGGQILTDGEWLGMRFFFGRGALATLSVLLMVQGGAMHLSGYQGRLTGAVSLLKTSLVVSEQVHRATSMECKVEMSAGDRRGLRYLIRWTVPEKTRVDCFEGKAPRNTVWVSGGIISIYDHGDGTLRTEDGTAGFMARRLQPAAGYLSPSEVVRCLQGHWSLANRESKAGSGSGFFRLSSPDRPFPLLLALDVSTHLPESLTVLTPESAQAAEERDFVTQAGFIWNRKIPSELLIPGAVLQSPEF